MTTAAKKKKPKPAASAPALLRISEALAYMFSVVRGNVPLVSLRLTSDSSVVLATYGKPVEDFRIMAVHAMADQLASGFEDETPVVVSFPLLLAACGIGKSGKKAAPSPDVKISLDRETRLLVVQRARSHTRLPLFPHQPDDDQYGQMLDTMATAPKTWTPLPVGRLLEAGDAMHANKLKMVDDLANAKSRASLVLQVSPSGTATAALSNNFSCLLRLLSKEAAAMEPVVVSVFAAGMLRALMRAPEEAVELRMLADKAAGNLLLLNKATKASLLLRLPMPAAGSPTPDDIAGLFATMMKSQTVMGKARLAGCNAGELKSVLTEATMFAEAGDGDDPVLDISLAKDMTLVVDAKKDSRTSASRNVEHALIANPPVAAWKQTPRLRVGAHGLRSLLAAIPDADSVLLYPSPEGNSLLIAHRAGKKLRSVAALTARAGDVTKQDEGNADE